jgi:zinc protease
MRRFAVVLLLLLAPLSARALEIERVVSPGGIEAWLVEEHSNPILALSFSFLGGSALDPVGKEGRARMATALLDEGAGTMDSQAFQGELERLSIELGFSVTDDELTGSLVTLTKDRDRAVELLSLALHEPRFDQEPVERVRAQLSVRVAQRANDPQSLAYETLQQQIFEGHPYARSSEGTIDSLAALTVDDLRAYVGQRLGLDTLKIGVVGDITPEELGLLLDRIFGGLATQSPPVEMTEATLPTDGQLTVIDIPVPQSVVYMAQPGPKRDDPDYYAAAVLNQILGGGTFASRLYAEVRESRGLAYSVWSDLVDRDRAGLWMAGAATQNARVADTLAIMREVWTKLAAEGPTAEEVKNAITYLTGSFALRLASSENIARILVSVQRDDLGIDYLDRRTGLYEAVNVEDVKRVAQQWLHPEQLVIVVAGQPEGVQSSAGSPQ